MNKLKRISLITLCSIILFATVTFAKTGTVNAPSGLVLRKQASKTSDPITTVNDKAKVEILEESGEWYKVKYNGNEGYLFAEYVNAEKEEEKAEEPKQEEPSAEPKEEPEEPKEEPSAKPEEEPKEEPETNSENNSNKEESKYPQKQKVKSDLKIYTIPSVTAKTIVSVKKDEEITVNYELNNWVNITYGKNTGWARKYFINNESKPVETKSDDTENKSSEDSKTNESTNVDTNKKGYIDVSSCANLRKEANTSSEIIDTLLRGAEVTIIGEEGDFYKIKYQDITGYISKSLVSDKPVAEVTSRSSTEERKSNDKQQSTVAKEENTENKENTKNTENTNKSTVTSNLSAGNNIVLFAKKYLGYNYVYGFTYYVFQSCGYTLGRTCQDQAKLGTAVSRQNLSAGDLIFFNNGSGGSIGHVGIYISGGQFIHSENSRTGVRIDTINSGFYNKCYYSARRIVK